LDQVPDVRRVEDPAEDPYAQAGPPTAIYSLIWPEPSTTYLKVQSSRRPMGPRACSFCVELPISAPIPNSAPSVKRVEAFPYTHAASTPSVNACSDSTESVTIAS